TAPAQRRAAAPVEHWVTAIRRRAPVGFHAVAGPARAPGARRTLPTARLICSRGSPSNAVRGAPPPTQPCAQTCDTDQRRDDLLRLRRVARDVRQDGPPHLWWQLGGRVRGSHRTLQLLVGLVTEVFGRRTPRPVTGRHDRPRFGHD